MPSDRDLHVAILAVLIGAATASTTGRVLEAAAVTGALYVFYVLGKGAPRS